MSTRDWLRPERLEARWRELPAAPAAPSPTATDDPIAWCRRLRELVATRFAAGKAIGLVVEELERLVERRFPHAGPAPADAAALDKKIEELLAIVEDLADAAALARSRP
jgi:hypothetical protein